MDLKKYLLGGDLRSIAEVDKLIPLIKNQNDFDRLFDILFSENRLEVMRAADAIEKITLNKGSYLQKHKNSLLKLLSTAQDKELKWHLALLASRIKLTNKDLEIVVSKLKEWISDKTESRIVRVNSIQALYNLSLQHKGLKKDFNLLVKNIRNENIASINARLKKLKIYF